MKMCRRRLSLNRVLPFGGIGLVEIARDDDRIAGGVRGLRTGRPQTRTRCACRPVTTRRYFPVVGSGLFVPDISARNRAPLPSGCAIARPALVADAAAIGDPLAIGRPHRVARRFLVAAEADSPSVGERHHPDLPVRPAVAVVVLDDVGDAGRVRRHLRRRRPIAASSGRGSASRSCANTATAFTGWRGVRSMCGSETCGCSSRAGVQPASSAVFYPPRRDGT